MWPHKCRSWVCPPTHHHSPWPTPSYTIVSCSKTRTCPHAWAHSWTCLYSSWSAPSALQTRYRLASMLSWNRHMPLLASCLFLIFLDGNRPSWSGCPIFAISKPMSSFRSRGCPVCLDRQSRNRSVWSLEYRLGDPRSRLSFAFQTCQAQMAHQQSRQAQPCTKVDATVQSCPWPYAVIDQLQIGHLRDTLASCDAWPLVGMGRRRIDCYVFLCYWIDIIALEQESFWMNWSLKHVVLSFELRVTSKCLWVCLTWENWVASAITWLAFNLDFIYSI